MAKSNIEHVVLHTQVQDFTTYKFLLGQIQGLQDAINICKKNYKVGDDRGEE